MKPGWIRLQSWMIGALASAAFMTGACIFALNDGVSIRAGDVEMTLRVSAENGLALHFLNAGL